MRTWINSDGSCLQEIKKRIELARAAFRLMQEVLCSNQMHFKIRTRLLRCYVYLVLFYGAKTWTLRKETLRRIEAFEMWSYRLMCRISWIDIISNIQVLRKTQKEKECAETIQRCKLEYLEHRMTNPKYCLPQLAPQGIVDGYKGKQTSVAYSHILTYF